MIRKISGKSKSPSFTHLNTKRETKATSNGRDSKHTWRNFFG